MMRDSLGLSGTFPLKSVYVTHTTLPAAPLGPASIHSLSSKWAVPLEAMSLRVGQQDGSVPPPPVHEEDERMAEVVLYSPTPFVPAVGSEGSLKLMSA